MYYIVIIFVGFRPYSAISPELQSRVRCSKKSSCNYLDSLQAKVAKRCIHIDLSLPKVAKSCNHFGLSLPKVSKSYKDHLHLSPRKPAKMYWLFSICRWQKSLWCFFVKNDIDLSLAKVGKRFKIISVCRQKKSQKVQSFRFIATKSRENVTHVVRFRG